MHRGIVRNRAAATQKTSAGAPASMETWKMKAASAGPTAQPERRPGKAVS
jgi:hypothetical protein